MYQRLMCGAALLLIAAPVCAVETFKTSNYGGAHQIWFEAEAFDERSPDVDTFYTVIDADDAFGQAINRTVRGEGMIRWSFDISKAGGSAGAWYFWGRVINPSNQSDFMIVEGDPDDPPLPDGPPFPRPGSAQGFENAQRIFDENAGPPWTWSGRNGAEAHTKTLQDGENTMYIVPRQGDNTLFWDVFMWTDDPAYVPTDEDYENAAAPTPGTASGPSPTSEAMDVRRDEILTWTPGEFASTHNLYFGTSFDDVNAGGVANPQGVLVSEGQDANSYNPEGVLAFGQTYYWRVDEVNGAPDRAVIPGEIWSFEVEPFSYPIEGITAAASGSGSAEAGPENTINGSGLDAMDQHSTKGTDMWLSSAGDQAWIQYEFTKIYKLHEMWVWNSNQMIESFVGLGVKEVTIETSQDGAVWTVLQDVPEFAQAPGKSTHTANTVVDFGGAMAKLVRISINAAWGILPQSGLSEVRFFSIPTNAREPQPVSGATVDGATTVLKWRAGREAVSHDVSLSTDSAAVVAGTAVLGTTGEARFDTGALSYSTTYFWKVDEVNQAGTPTTYAGDIWSFTTPDYGVVDDFDQYDNNCMRIFFAWEDGLGHSGGEDIEGCAVAPLNGNGGGSIVGNDQAPYAETTIVNAGSSQSMPFIYDNAFGPSEARLSIPGQDWTASAEQTLALAFRGTSGNTGTLYVKINTTKLTYDLDPTDIARTSWQAWNIDLTALSGLQNVTSLTIGVDGANAMGVLYIDDIRLYAQAGELITPTEPDNAGLMAYYAFEGNANDSSENGLDGTIIAGQVASSGSLSTGSALQLNLAGHVDLGNPATLDFGTGDWTVTAWFKTDMSGTGDANKGTIYGKGGDSGGGQRYALIMSETNEGVLTLVTDDDATKYVVDSSSVTNDNKWHFVAGQRVGNSIRILIDGQLEGSATAAEGYDLSGTTQHNAYIGAITNNGNGSLYKHFGGLIDEVKVFGRALSAEEIMWLAGRTEPVHKAL
jgi:hypothetical protein